MMKFSVLPLLLVSSLNFTTLSADSLDQAKSWMQTKEYEKAANLLDKLQQENTQKKGNDELLYYAARALYLNKEYAKARESAEKIIKEHTKSRWLGKARFLIADAYFLEGGHEKAASEYKELLQDSLKQERKVETANKLMQYAKSFADGEKEDGIVTVNPNYDAAYHIYSEVLDIECGVEIREQVRLKLLEVRQKQSNNLAVEQECLKYLAEFDQTWKGKIGSLERITSCDLKRFIAKGKFVGAVRFALAEALHRSNRRKLATIYLNEMIKQVKEGSMKESRGLLADAHWLRLHTLCQQGGKPLEFNYWIKEVHTYLEEHPTHIHADKTAYSIATSHAQWGDKEKAKQVYRDYINTNLGAQTVENPETEEEETQKSFTKRKQDTAKRKELALYNLGELHLSLHEFKKAKTVWEECLVKFPNGSQWPTIQNKLAQLEYDKLLYAIAQLPTDKEVDDTIATATAEIDAFVQAYPLHDKLVHLLYQRGNIPLTLAEKELEEENEQKAKELYRLAIEQWQPLLQRFAGDQKAKQAYEKSGLVYMQQLEEFEKGVELLKRAGTSSARALINSLDTELLTLQTPKSFTLKEKPFVEMNSRNVEKVKVKQYWMDATSYWRKTADIEQAVNLDLDLIDPDKSWEMTVEDYLEKRDKKSRIEIPFPQGKPGVCVIKVESENFESTTLVQRGNLDLVVSSSRKDLIVYVKDAVTNQPAAHVSVMVASEEEIIIEGKTDAKGVFYTALQLPENHSSYRVLVSGEQGVASSHIRNIFTSSAMERDIFGSSSRKENSSVEAWFMVDREETRVGDTIKINAVVRENKDGKFVYPTETDYHLEVRAGSVRLLSKDVQLSKEGFVAEKIRIPLATKVASISYTLTQKKDDSVVLRGIKNISKESELLGSATVSFEKSYAKEGDVLKGKVKASYRNGGPVAESKFTLYLPRGIKLEMKTDKNGEAEFTYDTLADLAGSTLNFSTSFSNVKLFSPEQWVVLDPVDLSIDSALSHSTAGVGQQLKLTCKTRDFKNKPVGAELQVEILKLSSSESLDILSGKTKLHRKLESLNVLSLTTDAQTGNAQHSLKFDKEGDYQLKVTGKDQYGVEVMDVMSIRVVGAASQDKIVLYSENAEVFDDQEMSIQLFSNLSQPTPVLLSYETYRSIERKVVTATKGMNEVKLKLDSRYSPGFKLTVLAIDEREFYMESLNVEVSTKLNIEASYVGLDEASKAKAGETLKAKLKVTDSNGQIVPAMVLATLNPSNLSELEEPTKVMPIFEDYSYDGNESVQHSSCGFIVNGAQKKRLVFSEENQQSVQKNAAASFAYQNGVQRVNKYLYKGEGYYNLGLFDKAHQEFDKVLKVDPYNMAARRWQSNVSNARSNYYRSAYDETRSRLLTEVDAAWEIIPSGAEGGGNEGSGIYTRNFSVAPDFVERLGGKSLQEGFESIGVKFPNSSNITFIPSTSTLSVTNTAEGLDQVEKLVSFVSSSGNNNVGGNIIFLGGKTRDSDLFRDGYGDSDENIFGGNGGDAFIGDAFNTPTVGLRSGDTAITRDSINFFLNNPSGAPRGDMLTRGLFAASATSYLPVWHSELMTLSQEQELSIPLPDLAGSWKLDFHGFDEGSRNAHTHLLIHTTAPYSLQIQAPQFVLEGDSFVPRVQVFRENADLAEEQELSVSVTVGTQTHDVVKKISFAQGELVQTVSLEKIASGEEGMIEIESTLTDLNFEKKIKLPVRPWGPVVADQRSVEVPAGQVKWLDLEIPKGAEAGYLTLSVTPSFDDYLLQLLREGAMFDPFCFSAIEDTHPSGRLIALSAVIEYLEKNNIKQGGELNNLKEQGKLLESELLSLMNKEGFWTRNSGTSYSDEWTTAFSYMALKRWSKLALVEETPIEKAEQWLLAHSKSLDLNNLERRALLQMALAFGERADFSECNRLLRNTGKLSSAAKLFLAKVFVLQERNSLAQGLVNEVFQEALEEWDAEDELAQRPTFMLAVALDVLASVENTPQAYIKLKQQLLALNQRSLSNSYIKAVVVSGLAAIEEKIAKQAGAKALGKGTVYQGDKEIFSFDLSDKDTPLSTFIDAGITEKEKLKIEFSGQSTVYFKARLLGHEKDYTRHTPNSFDVKRSGIYERKYFSPRLNYQGVSIGVESTSPVKTIAHGDEVVVWLRAVNYSNKQESVIFEPIPKGFSYVKGSFRGRHNGVTHENGRLTMKFKSKFNDRWLRYTLVATHPGEWKHQPSAFVLLADEDNPKYANATQLSVLQKGEKSSDVYLYNERELAKLAELQFKNDDFKNAEENINKMLAMKNVDLSKELAKMQLWIEEEKASPDARKLVNAFEVLDALDPDLDVPFSTLTKVADAYITLKEHEQAYYVYRALIDGSFSQDAVVAVALEKQNRKLDAIDVMQSLWMRYPESDTVGTSHFVYAQDLFAAAPNFKKLKQRDGVKEDLSEEFIYKEAIDLLRSYLVLHPTHPSADQASYAVCNGLFSLKDYEGVTEQAKKAVAVYTKSDLRNSFQYMVALGSFWQLKFDAAITAAEVIAKGDSEDKDLATFITAQIYHAQGKLNLAKKWYGKVKEVFPDAETSLDYFEQKKLSIEEVSLFDTSDVVSLEVEHRNVKQVKFSIYKVDLMQLYLKHQNLSAITSINLAGIEPDFSTEKALVQKVATNDEKTKITLPIKEDGAYLVICQGDYQYSSGLILKSPLKIEIQELTKNGKVRVNVKEKKSGKLLNGVHIKAIGSESKVFQKGDTDLRGIWESNTLRGKVTVIARDPKGRYAFFRGENKLSIVKPNAPSVNRSSQSSINYIGNNVRNQERLNDDNRSKREKFLEEKGKSIKLKSIRKK